MKFFVFIAALFHLYTFGQDTLQINQTTPPQEVPVDDSYQRFLEVVESSLFEYYKETWGKEKAYAIMDSLGYDCVEKPSFPDSIYIQRLNHLNEIAIIDIAINDEIIKTIKYFTNNRREYTAICIGRSKLYFPMYEEYLDKYNIPFELKYLSIIESGLRPTVKSRVGATGLWQFMYPTGRMFGLEIDSYIDERMDPVKSTDAACQYLKYLYGLYGDWNLALAAYNAGPGNVNKAIKRSGGKMDYWEIRPFLPKETQMYVPNFIAMMYMMTYYGEHNIQPKEAKVYLHEIDTLCLNSSIRISHLDSLIGMSNEDFLHLNPIYKLDIIPKTNPKQCIFLPIEKIDTFLTIENQLYTYDAYLDSTGQNYVELEKKKTHIVKENETLFQISQKYGVTVEEIRRWNNLNTTVIYPAQKLTIRIMEKKYYASPTAKTIASTEIKPASSETTSTAPKTTNDGTYKYYTLKSGESLWTVSQKLGIPFETIQALNKDLDPKRMQPGDLIKIGRL